MNRIVEVQGSDTTEAQSRLKSRFQKTLFPPIFAHLKTEIRINTYGQIDLSRSPDGADWLALHLCKIQVGGQAGCGQRTHAGDQQIHC